MVANTVVRKNFVFSIVEKCLRAGLTFVSLGVVGRYLGPEQYGLLSYILVLVTYFQLLGSFGLDHNLIRIFAERRDERKELFWKSAVFKTITSILSIALYVFFLFISGKGTSVGYLFGVTVIFAVLDNNRILLETLNQHHIVAKYEILYQITSAFLKICIAWMKLPAELLFAIFILDFLVPRVFLFKPLSKEITPIPSFKISWYEFKFFFHSGLFYCLNAILVIVYMKIDQVMIGNMLGLDALGNYAAAVRVSDAWYFIPVTISAIFYPLALSGDPQQQKKYIQMIFDLIVLVSILVIAPAIFFSDKIFGLMFGSKFNIDKNVLNLLFYSGFFISLNVATATWLNVKDLSSTLFLRALIGAGLNILVNYYFLPFYGLLGGALATFLSYTATIAVTFFLPHSGECRQYFFKSLNLFGSIPRILKVIRNE